jgi:hypothetical protein
MRVTRFDPSRDLIVKALLWGPSGIQADFKVAVDTGSAVTVLSPTILDRLGYSPRDGETAAIMRSAVAEEPGYLIRIKRFRTLGYEFTDFRVHAHDLPEGFEIEGLLGLNFLRAFNYEVRSGEGRIRVERLAGRRKARSGTGTRLRPSMRGNAVR